MAQRKTKILIADDERVIADMMALILNREGFEAVSAHSGLAAIEVARRFLPDAALLGFTMPDISGFEAGSHIRQFLPHVKIVIITEPVPPEVSVEMKSRGLDFPQLPGPIPPRALVPMLKLLGVESKAVEAAYHRAPGEPAA